MPADHYRRYKKKAPEKLPYVDLTMVWQVCHAETAAHWLRVLESQLERDKDEFREVRDALAVTTDKSKQIRLNNQRKLIQARGDAIKQLVARITEKYLKEPALVQG